LEHLPDAGALGPSMADRGPAAWTTASETPMVKTTLALLTAVAFVAAIVMALDLSGEPVAAQEGADAHVAAGKVQTKSSDKPPLLSAVEIGDAKAAQTLATAAQTLEGKGGPAPARPVVAPSAARPVPPKPPIKTTVETASPKAHTMRMLVTAYCPCTKCCGENAHGITASGKSVLANGSQFVAADTDVLPMYSHVSIPGYAGGARVPVLDRGGAIKGNRLDVYFASHKQAQAWGKKWLTVTVGE